MKAIILFTLLLVIVEGIHAQDEHDPSFSPDGAQIVFVYFQGEHPQLFTIDPKIRHHKKITDTPFPKLRPSFSPDGSTIIFNAIVGKENRRTYTIYTIHSDGTDNEKFTINWKNLLKEKR